MITFSIIIPVYNVENYLAECIDSCLAQQHNNIELILVDDGSTDASPTICDQYSAEHANISVIHKENGGLSSARNAGVAMARGKYILFMDSDDILASEALRVLSSAIQQYPSADMVQFEYQEFDATPPTTSDTKLRVEANEEDRYAMFKHLQRLGGSGASACTKLIRHDLFDAIKFENGKLHEDEFFTTELLQRVKQVVYIHNVLYYYRKRTTSITHSRFSSKRLDALEAIEKRIAVLDQLNFHDLARKERLRFEHVCVQLYYQARLHGMKHEASICQHKLLTFPSSSVDYDKLKERFFIQLSKKISSSLYLYYVGRKLKHTPVCTTAKNALTKVKDVFFILLNRICLRNRRFSIISNNCWAGSVYQKYKLPYTSPTIGLFIFEDDYIKFLEKLRYYLTIEPVFIPLQESRHAHRMVRLNLKNVKFPIARLDDIEIFFQHYHSEQEAMEKWKRRSARVNFDNLIVKFSERQFCTRELIQLFERLPYNNKICFTADHIETESDCTYITVPELHELNAHGGNEIPYTFHHINITRYINHIK